MNHRKITIGKHGRRFVEDEKAAALEQRVQLGLAKTAGIGKEYW